MKKGIKPITKCRVCGSKKLKPIMSLGDHYVSGFVKSEKDQGIKVPLALVLCEDCKLLQMEYSAPPELLWNEQYWYKSAINSVIRNDLKNIVRRVEELTDLKDKDIVVDIGNNDGTMFDYYKNRNLRLVGIDPCKNVSDEAKAKGYEVINDFFNAEAYRKNYPTEKAKVITAISMFYDLEDPNTFLEDIKSCLDEDGLFVIQQNYLVSMLEQVAFDNICHEHREYYSLTSLSKLLGRHGLEVFDVSLNDINGGSIRTFIRRSGNQKVKGFPGSDERLETIYMKEKELELDTLKPYLEFASKIDSIKKQVRDFLYKAKKEGKTVGLCGASTRGNTILQYFNITPNLVVGASEANPDKHGLKTIGTLIPIISIDKMKELKPDYQLVLIWHLFEGLRDKEKNFLKEGGKFILPLPRVKIVSGEKEDE